MTIHPDLTHPTPQERQFRGRLRNAFLGTLLPVSLLFILILGSLTFIQARSLIEEQLHGQLDDNLHSVAIEIRDWETIKNIRLGLASNQVPFQNALNTVIAAEDPTSQSFLSAREFILERLQSTTKSETELTFKEFIITTRDGAVVLASQADWEGINLSETGFFQSLFDRNKSIAVYAPRPISNDQLVVLTSYPYLDSNGQTQAMVFGVSSVLPLQNILAEVPRLHPNAKSYILTEENDFIGFPYSNIFTRLEPSDQQADVLPQQKASYIFGESELQHEIFSITSFDDTPVVADFTWLSSLDIGLVIEIPQETAFGFLDRLAPFTIILTVTLGALLTIFILLATRRLVNPILDLTESAGKFARGEWDQRARVFREDEIGRLSYTFNQMAEDLAKSYRSLEVQVAERTQSLGRRTKQLEATAQVARETAAIHDLDELLAYATHLISEHFDFYHTGIFMLDEARRYAILQASNSEGGQRMLARAHKLEVGQTGVVGHVAATGQPRIALDVGSDAFFFNNPDLPETRSEIALPLKIRNKVAGVLDVQSTEPEAFTDADVEVLQVLADQISLAIENTRLLEQSQNTLRELQSIHGKQVRQGWQEQLGDQRKAYYFDRVRVKSFARDVSDFSEAGANHEPGIVLENGKQVLSVPIIIRGQRLGNILLRREKEEVPWTPEDIILAKDSISQIAVALDSARLLDETKRRADYEQTVSEISTRISRSIDIDSILRTAVREFGKLPNVKDASIHIGPSRES